MPSILPVDLDSGPVSFKAFMTAKKPTGAPKRFLAIAAWLLEQRKVAVINADHVYTCYRSLNWNAPPDPSKPFRYGKRKGWFDSKGDGQYSINHVGLGVVNSMPGPQGLPE